MNSVTKSELAKILPAADVGLMSVDNIPHMQTNCANKFFDCLSCGLPVLLNYGGWQKEVLDKYSAGLGCDNFNDDEFLKNTLTLLRNPNLRETMAQNARRIAEEKFDRDKLAAQALDVISSVAV
jgi:glycosyltransferase involved in cell wall biosynthesis